MVLQTSQVELVVKDPAVSAGDTGDAGLIPGSGRSPGGGNGDSPQYSCLETPVGRGSQSTGQQSVRRDRATEHTHMT